MTATNKTFRPNMECLEDRINMSWGTTPPLSVSVPSSTNASLVSNLRTGYAAITNNEVDYYKFVAPRTGDYTIKAQARVSNIDTVLGVYSSAKQLLRGNDDYNGLHDSQVNIKLTSGKTYYFGITNYTGSANGNYTWTVVGPTMTRSKSFFNGDFTTYGTAKLEANILTITVKGINSSTWTDRDHTTEIQLLDSRGLPIHTGSWKLTVTTAGTMDFTGPSQDSDTWEIDLTGWDLSQMRSISMTLYA